MKPEQLGPFAIGPILGAGGFGTVYRAKDADGRPAAVKVLAPHVDSEETLQRFELEGTIRIEHPNVVRVLDAGRDDGVSYIAFELLEGQPLTQRLQAAPLPPKAAIEMARQIAAGLGAAHDRDIVHRDLKPGNVFCCEDGPIKILDFGIARPMSQAGPQLTMAGSVIGTPGYLSPEQARGDESILPAADLWSLGVILYQALTGTNPFIRSTAVATILAVVLEEAPPLEGMPSGLADIVMKCLKKDPAARWASAVELSEALATVDVTTGRVSERPPAPPIAEDEHRVVAVLLASGVHDLDALSASVAEWGGELIPVVGGAIGLFGGQTYQGDEGVRATRAALSARDAARYIAVSTGRATGSGGTIGGDAVRAVERAVEARLSGVAVDATTARAVEGELEVAPSETDGVYEVRARGGRETGTFPAVRQDLPLLGRTAELAQLDAALARAFDEGRATAVTTVGPPGVGKSRLRAELEARLSERGVEVLAGRGESHKREVAFHVMQQVLRSEATLEPFFLDPAVRVERRRDALARFLSETLGDAVWARQTQEPLSLILGLDDLERGATVSMRKADPQRVTDRVRVALSDVLGAIASKRPLAVVIDDAQWADDASLRFLEELLGRYAERPLLVFVATRPELFDAHPWFLADEDVRTVRPRGLSSADVAKLAAALARREVGEAVTEAIAARTGGNPFFVEQIVRELVEQGRLDAPPAELPIPVDVEGAVQSRLDQLPAGEKQLCKRASVFTDGVTSPALLAVGEREPEALLGALARRGLMAKRGAMAEGAYRFRHALVADVAYRMNGEEARRELHRLAAGYLKELPDTDPAALAEHWERAGLDGAAAEAWADAAARAARRGDSASVRRAADRATELGLGGARAFEVALLAADACSFLGDRDGQRRALDAALEGARPGAERARALSEKAGYLASVQARDEGLEIARRAVEEARAVDAPDVLATALARMGWLLLYAGELTEARAAIMEASRMEGLAADTRALIAAWRAQVHSALGELEKRKEAYEETVLRYREVGDLRRAATAETNLADTLNRFGAYEEAERALREAVRSCRRVGNRAVEGYALANLGYALAGMGRLEEAGAAFDEAEALARARELPRLEVAVGLYRARVASSALEPALGLAERALEMGLKAIAASALAVAAHHAIGLGHREEALGHARRAMALRDELGSMEEDEAEIFLALAQALAATGARREAQEVAALGVSRLERLAQRIEDAALRARFLSEVPVHRDLIMFEDLHSAS